jgi:uncharacterized protein (TIGR02266 family)
MTEEKKDQRVKAPVLRAKYKSRTLDEFIEKYSRDISRSGMWIKSPKPPALGTLLKVEILLEDGSPVISAVGRVVKRRDESEAGPDNPAGMGIRFLKLEDASQGTIDRIVALKGEDAGPHFDNIRTGQTVPPPSAAEPQSGFFAATGATSQQPPESDRTMMRQMNALLGEALRQVNESAPRKDAAGLPAQKATIMGVAAPAGMLQQAIAAGREEQKKADEGPTKVATRSEIDIAIEKSKTVEETPKAEPAKAEAPKAEPVKAEPVKTEPVKAEAPKPPPRTAEPVTAPLAKVEDKKNDSDRSASRSVPPRSLRGASIPPPPSSRPLTSAETSSAPPPEPKAAEKPAEAKAAEPVTLEKKADVAPAEAKAEEKAAEVKAEEKAAEVKAEPIALEKKSDEKAAEVKAEEKAPEPKAAEAKAEPIALEKKAEPVVLEKKAEPIALEKKDEPKTEEPKAAAAVALEKKAEPVVVAAPKADVALEKKPEEKKADAKPEEKKAVAPPQPEGSAVSLLIAIAVIAGLAFAVYKWLLNP